MKNSKKAFTLVEVLVAIILFSLLMSISLFSFKFFINKLDNVETSNPEKVISYEYLNNSISGLYFYPKEKSYFFQKDNNSITYVTNNSIYYSEIVIAKIEFKDDKLYYFESKLYDKKQNFLDPKILENSFNYLILDNIKDFNIKLDNIKDSIPSLITFTFTKNNNLNTWIFKVDSNFYNFKKDLKRDENF